MDPSAPASARPSGGGGGGPRLRLALALGVLGAVALALQIAGFHDLRQDDAYITYRYGQNLAEGRGLVFNPGERLMGSTSPLHSLLSAAVYPLAGGGRLPSAMAALGCVGWTAQALAVLLLLAPALGRLPSLLIAAAVAAGAAWSFEWVSLETNLAAAFALWAVVAATAAADGPDRLAGRRWTAAAALVALAGLTRPDAYLLGLPLGLLALGDLRRGRVGPWRPLAAFAGITLPWLVFAWSYYGTVLPQSARAKVGRVAAGDYLVHLLDDPTKILLLGRDSAPWIAVAWLLAAVGAAYLVVRRRTAWVVPAWGGLHFVAYWLLRPFAQHRWHLYPLVLVVVVCALAAVGAAARFEPRRLARPLALAALAVLVVLYARRSVHWSEAHEHGYWWGDRDRAYRLAARYLIEHGRPESDVVAAVEVGTLAYYSGFRMWDLGGLVTRLPTSPREWPRPDWFVLDPLYLPRVVGLEPEAVLSDGSFQAYVLRVPPPPSGADRRSPAVSHRSPEMP